MTARHQQARARHCSAGNGQRHRGSQRQRTGTTDDQYGNRDPQRLPGVDERPGDGHADRQEQQTDDETTGDAIGQFDDPGFLHRRTFHQPDDRRQARAFADLRHLDQQGAFDIHCTTGHGHARALAHRRTLPGEQCLVGSAFPLDDPPIRRNGFPGFDQDDIARAQVGSHHLHKVALVGIRGHTRCDHRHQPGQSLGDADRTLSGGHFQEAPAQQEENEHRHRVEINFPAGRQRRPDTGREGSANPQGDRHIHAHPTESQIAPGVAEKWRCRIEHHRQRQHQAGPAHQLFDRRRHLAVARQIHRYGVHHHLHHAEAGDKHPPQRCPPLLAREFLALRRIVGISAIADRGDCRKNPGQPDPPLVPADTRTPRRVVDVHRGHPGQARQVLLVQPDTRRTGDPFENQRRLALAAVRPLAADAHETLLEIGMIIKLQALDDRRHGLARGIRQGITIAVVIDQAVVYNRLRHRLTAATTHAARLPVDIYREIHSGRHGLSAVVAITRVHHCQEDVDRACWPALSRVSRVAWPAPALSSPRWRRRAPGAPPPGYRTHSGLSAPTALHSEPASAPHRV